MAAGSFSGFTGKRMPRWLAGATAAAVVMLGMPALSLAPAAAVTVPATGGTPGGFEIDGNMTFDGNEPANPDPATMDWATVYGQPGFVQTSDPVGNADPSVFSASSKESADPSTWTVAPGTAPGKTDIGGIWLYKQQTTDAQGNTHLWSYMAWDRDKGTGTNYFYLEFNKNPNVSSTSPIPQRSVNDVRLVVHSQGSGLLHLDEADQWDGSQWVAHTAPAGSFYGAVNTASLTLPTGFSSPNADNGVLGSNQFYEIGFDFAALGLQPACPSPGFGTLNFRAATGQAPDELKDYVDPMTFTVPSTCADLTINKQDEAGNGLAGAYFTLTATGKTPSSYGPYSFGPTDSSGQFSRTDLQPGTYDATETTAPPGYILLTDKQTQPVTLVTGSNDALNFYDPQGAITWTKSYDRPTTAMVNGTAPGATFSITRNANTGTGAFSPMTVTDNGANDLDPALGAIEVAQLPPGDYTITETAAPVGFELVPNVTATASIPTSALSSSLTKVNGVLTLVEAATGGFTNPRLPVPLTVKKTGSDGTLVQGATFDLYRVNGVADYSPNRPNGDPNDTLVTSGLTTGANGVTTPYSVDWGYSYYFVETSVPAPWNLPDVTHTSAQAVTAQQATDGVTVRFSFTDPRSTITTSATPNDVLPDASLTDTATLSGISSTAKGSITFTAYGPYAADATATCDKVAFTSNAIPVSGPGAYTSNAFVTNAAGRYFWIASYTGDGAGALPVSGTCGDSGETSLVEPLTTGLTTVATPTAQLPTGTIHDVAKIQPVTSNAGSLGGSVTFTVYGPDSGQTTCSVVAATYTVAVTPAMVHLSGGVYYLEVTSPDFTPSLAGVYHWSASYTGTPDDPQTVTASSEDCNAATVAETSTVAKAQTTTTTTSSQYVNHANVPQQLPNVTVGDTATVTGLNTGAPATGDVTFTLYGPVTHLATCTAKVAYTSATISLHDNGDGTGTASVSGVTVDNAGTYYWVASYSGDANNTASADQCGEASEKIVVDPAQPSIATTAGGTVQLGTGSTGATITDHIVVSGLTDNATGTVSVAVYGPVTGSSFTCTSPAGTYGPVTVDGQVVNGVFTADASVTVQQAGTYWWQASYTSGDGNNLDVTHACGLVDKTSNEVSTVTKTTPKISTQATATVNLPVGGASVNISDTATVTGLHDGATGNVVFTLYGPVAAGDLNPDTNCTTQVGDPITVSLVSTTDGSGTGTASSGDVAVSQPGTYFWVASYKGDANNGTANGSCNDANEASLVTQAVPHIAKIVQDASGKDLTGAVAVGTTLTYTVTVSNTGTADATGPVTDVLPVGLDAPTGLPSTASYDSTTRTITWPNITVAAGGSLDLTYQAKVNSSAATGDGTLVNDASWFNLHADVTVYVKWIGMTVEPTCNPDTHAVTVGYTVTSHNFNVLGNGNTYTVDLAWNGGAQGSAGTAFPLSDSTPVSGTLYYPGVTVDSSGQAITWPGWTYDSQTNTWTPNPSDPNLPTADLTAVSNGTSVTQTVAYVNSPDCQPPGVPSIVKSSPTEVGSELNPSGVVHPGDTIHYDITLTNNGGTAITSDLVDTLPAGVTPVDGTFTPKDPEDTTANPLVWYDVTVAAQSSVTYSFDVTVDAGVKPGDLVNTATWDDMSSQATHVVKSGTPTIDKSSPTEKGSTANPSGDVLPGATIDYKITLGNTGGSRLTSDLVDTLPAGVTPVPGSYNVAPTSVNGQVITWAGESIDPGKTFVITFKVTVNGNVAPGNLVNTATWDGMSDSTTHVVTPGTPGIDKSSPTEQGSVVNPSGDVNPGNTIHYSILLSNTGGSALTSDLVDTLPAGVTPVAGTYSPSAPQVNGSTLTWPSVTVGAGQTVQFTFDVTVNTTTGAGQLVNQATWHGKSDQTIHNVVIPPVLSANPTLVKTSDPASGSIVGAGQVITYTVKVGNTGNAVQAGDLVDTLPTGVTPVDGSYTKDGAAFAPDSVTSTTITWKNVTVQPGQTITFAYKVTVTSATGGITLVNTAKYLGLVSSTSHTLPAIPATGGELPKTGAPFDPIAGLLWATMLLALGVMFLVFGRRNDEQED